MAIRLPNFSVGYGFVDSTGNLTRESLRRLNDIILALGEVATAGTGAAWAAATGTEARTAFASYTAPVVSNPPTQAQVQGIANEVAAISQALVALVNDLRATGAIAS